MFKVEKATIKDAVQMQKLINGFAAKELMLPRPLGAIYENLRDYFVIREGERVIACAALHISWEDLARKWQRAHPEDPLKPDTLRRYWHRARTDSRVCESYIRDQRRLWLRWAERLGELEKAGARREDMFVRHTEPRPVHPDVARALGLPSGALVREEVYTAKPRPQVAAALRAAAGAKCVWTARLFTFPRDVRLCTRRDCRGCRILRALRNSDILDIPSDLLRNRELLAAWREEEVRRFREQFVPRAQ